MAEDLTIPLPGLRPITDQAVATVIDQVKKDPPQVKLKASTADRGSAQLSIHARHKQLAAAGYVGWKRALGVEAGAEVTFDLRKP